MAATIEAIAQAQCEDCGSREGAHSVVTRLFTEKGMYRHVRCDCSAESVVRISEKGLSHGGPISYDDASWSGE